MTTGAPAPLSGAYPALRPPAPPPRPPRPCRLGGGASGPARLMPRPTASLARTAAAGRLIKTTWAASNPMGQSGAEATRPTHLSRRERAPPAAAGNGAAAPPPRRRGTGGRCGGCGGLALPACLLLASGVPGRGEPSSAGRRAARRPLLPHGLGGTDSRAPSGEETWPPHQGRRSVSGTSEGP